MTSLIETITIGDVSHVQAASFNTVSQLGLELTNFNRSPNGVAELVEKELTTIAEIGVVIAERNLDAFFKAENSSVIASSYAETSIFGTGSDLVGLSNIDTSLLGSFYIFSHETLKFDVNAYLSLINFTENPDLLALSTFGDISLFIQDSSNQELYNVFNLKGFLNTNSTTELSQDLLNFTPSSYFKEINYQEQVLFGGNQELIDFSLTGLFEKEFETDTIVNLVAVTRTCNYGSNIVNVCPKISEPSNKLALLFYLICYLNVVLLSRIIKFIIHLTHQPLLKHFINYFLINFRR